MQRDMERAPISRWMKVNSVIEVLHQGSLEALPAFASQRACLSLAACQVVHFDWKLDICHCLCRPCGGVHGRNCFRSGLWVAWLGITVGFVGPAGRVGAVYSCLEAASSSVPPFPTVTHEAESQTHEASVYRPSAYSQQFDFRLLLPRFDSLIWSERWQQERPSGREISYHRQALDKTRLLTKAAVQKLEKSWGTTKVTTQIEPTGQVWHDWHSCRGWQDPQRQKLEAWRTTNLPKCSFFLFSPTKIANYRPQQKFSEKASRCRVTKTRWRYFGGLSSLFSPSQSPRSSSTSSTLRYFKVGDIPQLFSVSNGPNNASWLQSIAMTPARKSGIAPIENGLTLTDGAAHPCPAFLYPPKNNPCPDSLIILLKISLLLLI